MEEMEKPVYLLEEGFDFDFWAELARSDPEAFDQRRRELLEKAIHLCKSDKRRMRGLQNRIELERRKAGVPLKACLRLSGLMWESFGELNGRLNGPSRLTLVKPNAAPPATARILPFRGLAPGCPSPSR